MAGGAWYDNGQLDSAATFGADGEVTGIDLLIAAVVSRLPTGVGRLGGRHITSRPSLIPCALIHSASAPGACSPRPEHG